VTHMRHVVANSSWLVVTPLVLNIVSLFVVGYVARTLGHVAYGSYAYAFAFVAMFTPLLHMGLGSLSTRTIAEQRAQASTFFWKMLVLRFFLASTAFVLAILAVTFLGVPSATRTLVYVHRVRCSSTP